MNFLVWMGNHTETGQRSLEDVVGIFGKQLRALGHTIIWDPSNSQFITADRGINIVVEGFTPGSIEALEKAHKQNCRFIILATEEPSPQGFNQGVQPEMVKRQTDFAGVARFAEAILHLVPGEHVTCWYGQFLPTAQIELGYAPTLIRKPLGREPEYDFGFYGSITKRRHVLLKKLAKCSSSKKAVRIVGDFMPQVERDLIMQNCKVIVQLRKFEKMGLVSSSRCNTALCLGRPVVAEPHLLVKPWDEVIKFADTEKHFFDLCIMARASWKSLWYQQFENFKQKFSPEFCVGNALKQVGILEERKAA